MKEKLLKLLKAKNEARAAKMAEVDKATDVTVLRSLNTEIEGIDTEIRSLQGMIDEIPDEAGLRTAVVNGEIPGVVKAGATEQRKAVDTEGMEYRKAFQQFVTRGTPIPMELRDEPTDATTATTDIASAIPSVLINKIVETMESTGMILPLVTRTSFASGVSIPTSSVKPVATWVNEGAGSLKQKKETLAITFTKYKLRCEIAMTMEAGTMAISAFEASFVKNVVEAMIKAIEGKILSDAAGTTSMQGILSVTPVTGQALTAKKLSYELITNAEGALPQAYENGAVWCMTKKTFMSYIGMTDAEGQPVARINYGIGGKPERSLLGRTVVLCGDYMESFSTTLTTGKIFAILFNFADYAINTVYDMGVQRKQDWDTEDLLTKAVMSLDGKVIDINSLVTIAKSA